MRVVVIGGTGNVGTATAGRLSAQGHDVVTASRRPPVPGGGVVGSSWRPLDVAAASAPASLERMLRHADVCIYAAWGIQPMRRPDYQKRVGVGGLDRTITACLDAGVRHLVALSSSAAYAPRLDLAPVREDYPTTGNEVCAYSRQKAATERLLERAVADQGIRARMVLSWLRPSLVCQRAAAGSLGRVGVAPVLPRRILPALPVMPLDKGAVMQVTHADDVAQAIALLVRAQVPGPFNLAAPDLLGPEEIAAPLGGRPLGLPGRVVLAAADVAWFLRLWPLDPGWLRMARDVPMLDPSRAQRELGWVATTAGAAAWAELVDGMARGHGGSQPALRRRSVGDDVVTLLTRGPVTRRALT